MAKVLISGGTGLVGKRLTELLSQQEYEVTHLSRSKGDGKQKTILWNPENMQLNASKIAEFDYIIHLAGAGIVDKPWTDQRKKVILESRSKSAELLQKAIAQNAKKPLSFVSASAVGFYGFETSEHIFKETDVPGSDFLADTCLAWENSVNRIADLGIPTAKIRIGLVMAAEGGALKEIAKPIKMGLGAVLGSGKQYMPWIHIDDLCRLFIFAMEKKLEGAYNAAVPSDKQVNNAVFTKQLAKTLKKPIILPAIPAFVMKVILGSRALLVLKGSRVDSTKIQKAGFKFKFTELKEALAEIYG